MKSTDKITFNCENCGKETTIRYFLFEHKKKKLCRSCTMKETYGGEEAKKQAYAERAKKSKATQLKRYGAIGNQRPDANEKRMKTIKERYGDDFYSKMFSSYFKSKSQEEWNITNDKRKKTNLEKYGKCSTGFLHAYYFIDGIYLDSLYEFYYYVYCRDHGIKLIREPFGISFFEDGVKKTYYPDFLSPEGLVELKSDYYYNLLSKEKLEIMKSNNVKIIKNNEIKLYKNYVLEKYGKKYALSFKIL